MVTSTDELNSHLHRSLDRLPGLGPQQQRATSRSSRNDSAGDKRDGSGSPGPQQPITQHQLHRSHRIPLRHHTHPTPPPRAPNPPRQAHQTRLTDLHPHLRPTHLHDREVLLQLRTLTPAIRLPERQPLRPPHAATSPRRASSRHSSRRASSRRTSPRHSSRHTSPRRTRSRHSSRHTSPGRTSPTHTSPGRSSRHVELTAAGQQRRPMKDRVPTRSHPRQPHRQVRRPETNITTSYRRPRRPRRPRTFQALLQTQILHNALTAQARQDRRGEAEQPLRSRFLHHRLTPIQQPGISTTRPDRPVDG